MQPTWLNVTVVERRYETEDIAAFTLVEANGGTLPTFSAGSHIDVETPSGTVRQYSLCNSPSEADRYRIGVLRDPNSRGGSRDMHESVKPGSRLRISAPKNFFPLLPALHYVLLAGGIGITPLLAMADQLTREGASFELHYCTRGQQRTAFVNHIRESQFANNVHFHFDDEDAEQRLNIERVLGTPQEGRSLYVCGPRGFMDAVIATADRLSWPKTQVNYEFFSGDTPSQSGEAFDVVLAKSHRVIHIREGVTVLDALREHDIDVPASCEQGVCGTCATQVLEGIPDHRDLFFTDDERARNDQFTPCCSRSRTARLVLAL